MKRLFVIVLLVLSMVSFGDALENDGADVAQRLKALESQHKLLEESYKNKLDDLNAKFNLKSQELDQKNRQIEEYRKTLDDRFDVGTKNIEVRINKIEGLAALIITFLGLGTIGLIISLRNYAEKKAKEMFDARFAVEFEKLFAAREHIIKRIIKYEDEANQLKLSKSIQVLNLPGANADFLRDFFPKTGFINVSFDTFDPNNIVANKDLILFNYDDMDKNDQILKEVGKYIKELPKTIIGFYLGQGIVPDVGSNFASANIRFQLYGNLISALRYQELLKA